VFVEDTRGSGAQDAKGLNVPVDFVPYRVPAECAAIFVFVSLGQNQQKRLLYRNRSPALDTIEFGGFEFIETRLRLSGGASFHGWETGKSIGHHRLLKTEISAVGWVERSETHRF
jgi:hypothetical protein